MQRNWAPDLKKSAAAAVPESRHKSLPQEKDPAMDRV
jgi:hypothetical protein